MSAPEFDFIIVGSGPAGVSAAYPLLESGKTVLMIDAGGSAVVDPPDKSFLDVRSDDNTQWQWMVGKNFHALRNLESVSPKLRVPTHEHVFKGFSTENHIRADAVVAVGSLARGGLSNAWGCGVSTLSDQEIEHFPFSKQEIIGSYESVCRRIGVSGANDDDLREYFGVDEWSQLPLDLDVIHQYLLKNYERKRAKLGKQGVLIGRSRIAVLKDNMDGREACDYSGNCMWGCHKKALYSAAGELPFLRKYENFKEITGVVVCDLQKNGDYWVVNGKDKTGVNTSFSASRVVMAAGTLATTRLILQALEFSHPVKLLSSPTAAFLLWVPKYLGLKRQSSFGLGQLSFSLENWMKEGEPVFGSTFNVTGISMSEFLRHIPLSRRFGVDFLRALLSSCIVGNAFLPGSLSDISVQLAADCSLLIKGGYKTRLNELMTQLHLTLRRIYWELGAFLLPGSFTIGKPGGDIHYAGTLPMTYEPEIGECNSIGEVEGLKGVFVVDGACLSTLPEKSHTLTIMANADRIGRVLGK